MTKQLRILLAATILFSPTVFAENNLKIVVIDVQYVLDNSNAVNNLRKAIDDLSEKLHKEMSDKEIALKNIEAELIKKQSILKPEEFDIQVNKFHQKVSEAQHEMQNKKNNLEKAHAEAIGIVHDSTIKIIAELAKEQNFDLALPTAQILYANTNLSITKKVVDRLNQKIKSIPLNYK
ncbi:MAG UNVERIFIED_CONTAM: OmpH family outer membrane protein [Rickettsiaceae bacterium]